MLTKSVLETQAAIELPARELMFWDTNIANVLVGQTNLSAQFGVGNLAGQSNTAVVIVAQSA
jgi:hypothetical protein